MGNCTASKPTHCPFNKYGLLIPHQSGFRSGHSTQDVLLHVTDRWLRAIDEGKYTGAVFLDLAKAFDTVNHTILCSKLRHYGFQEALYDLLYAYLSNRQQRTLFNGDISDWGTIAIGVPQGSILDLLLFALYLNDLPIATQLSNIPFYICMLMQLGTMEAHVQSNLDAVALWLCSSQLCLNVVKSNAMLIGSHQRTAGKSLNVSVGGTVLNQFNSVCTWVFQLILHYHGHYVFVTYIVSRVRFRLSSTFLL